MLWKSKTSVVETAPQLPKARKLLDWETDAIYAYEIREEKQKMIDDSEEKEGALFLSQKLKEILDLNVLPDDCDGNSWKPPDWNFHLFWGNSNKDTDLGLAAYTSHWLYRVETRADLGERIKSSLGSQKLQRGIRTRKIS